MRDTSLKTMQIIGKMYVIKLAFSKAQFSIYFTVVTCSALNLSHGEVTYNQLSIDGRYPANSTAYFSCDSMYFPIGPESSTCDFFGNWSNQTLTCQSKLNSCGNDL